MHPLAEPIGSDPGNVPANLNRPGRLEIAAIATQCRPGEVRYQAAIDRRQISRFQRNPSMHGHP
jgi:hypothetical protein